jgi:hypothetical protein
MSEWVWIPALWVAIGAGTLVITRICIGPIPADMRGQVVFWWPLLGPIVTAVCLCVTIRERMERQTKLRNSIATGEANNV